MRTNRQMWGSIIAAIALLIPSIADAQARGGGGRGAAVGVELRKSVQILNVEPSENVPGITNAPFAAEATTEFVQVLSDGNRIEQRFTSSLARDGRGRTRTEREVAMVGPLVVLQKDWTKGPSAAGDPPRLVVITDPVDGATYTLDDQRKEARRSPLKPALTQAFEAKTVEYHKMLAADGSGGVSKVVVESIGTRQIEGVSADGVRSTTTIPAGEIGNLNPIQVVTERWFSKELQMAVLITRRDPRSGDTVYRLTSIVRAEPPPDLFTVPADYRVVDLNKKKLDDLHLELKKIEDLQLTLKKIEKARTRAQ